MEFVECMRSTLPVKCSLYIMLIQPVGANVCVVCITVSGYSYAVVGAINEKTFRL